MLPAWVDDSWIRRPHKAISVRHPDAVCSNNVGTSNVIYVLQNF